jgi:fatty-acyl-CoA synthase
MVADPVALTPVPRDGTTLGEVMLRGNTVMKGYLRNPAATEEAFRGDWFHTGDLAVWHPDGYVEIKDRSKDVIISGGENISSLEVEEVLYRHPAVMEAAVVARPDPWWGETPCAFVTLRPDAAPVTAAEIVAWCREHLAPFKAPRAVVFGPLPKTSTGKIQKYVLREQAKAGESTRTSRASWPGRVARSPRAVPSSRSGRPSRSWRSTTSAPSWSWTRPARRRACCPSATSSARPPVTSGSSPGPSARS